MKKTQYFGGFVVATLLLGSAFSAHAQSNGYQYNYTYNNSNTTCISLTNYLSLGSVDSGNGGQVTMLQQFLNQTGYLSGVSGFYNQGTYGAVVNYQREHNIPQTGTVGPVTRIAINQQSCNGNYTNTNGNTNNNTNNGSVSISSLSSTSGVSGSSVTIYGTNLTNSNPVVHFGGNTVSTSYSTSNAITFTVPAFSTGTYQIYVSSSYGTSNSLSYTVTGSNNNNNCTYVNGSNQCGCINNQNYSYNYSYNNNNGYSYSNCDNNSNSNTSNWYSGTNGTPKISSVIGQGSASTGTSYTWSASAYSQNGLPVTVSVDWADGTSFSSSQGYNNGSQQQSFPFSHTYSNPGMYTIRFTATDSSGAYAYSTQLVNVTGSYNNNYNNNYNYNNNNGTTSNCNYNNTNNCNCTYNYNNSNCNYNNNYNNNYTYSYTKPAISYLSQMSGTRGSTITISGSNFSPNVTVLFGGASYYTTSFNNGSSVTFTIPYYSPGNYVLSVTNANGDNSNGLSFILY